MSATRGFAFHWSLRMRLILANLFRLRSVPLPALSMRLNKEPMLGSVLLWGHSNFESLKLPRVLFEEERPCGFAIHPP